MVAQESPSSKALGLTRSEVKRRLWVIATLSEVLHQRSQAGLGEVACPACQADQEGQLKTIARAARMHGHLLKIIDTI